MKSKKFWLKNVTDKIERGYISLCYDIGKALDPWTLDDSMQYGEHDPRKGLMAAIEFLNSYLNEEFDFQIYRYRNRAEKLLLALNTR